MPPPLPPFSDPAHQIPLVIGRGDEGSKAIKRPESWIGRDNLTDSGVEADGLGGFEGPSSRKDVPEPVGEPGRPTLVDFRFGTG